MLWGRRHKGRQLSVSFRSRRGLRQLLPDVQSFPSPSRQGWALWAPCVAIATKASEHQGQAEGYTVHACLKLWFPNKTFTLKELLHNPGLMFDPVAWGAFFSAGYCDFALMIMHWSAMFCILSCTCHYWGRRLYSDQEKVSWLWAVVLLTQTGTVQRLWTAHRSLVSALILDTHCNSGPTGLQ